MSETPKRLPTLRNDLRILFSYSNNQCTFPGCGYKLFDDSSRFVGELSHIEGVKKGSARFNPALSNEYRRSEMNLILMCPNHHKQIDNDEITFTPMVLYEMKQKHEFVNRTRPVDLTDKMYELVRDEFDKINSQLEQIAKGNHKETPIRYVASEKSLKTEIREVVQRVKWINVILLISTFITFLVFYYFLLNQKNSSKWLGNIWIGVFAITLAYLYFTAYYLKPVGKEIYYRSKFRKVNADGSLTSYTKLAECNWPQCSGIVYIDDPPPREKNNHKLIGRCHQADTLHTFSYQNDGLGFYTKIDFGEPEQNRK